MHTWSRLLGDLSARFTGLYCSSALEASTGKHGCMSEHPSHGRERHVSTLQACGLHRGWWTLSVMRKMDGLLNRICTKTHLLFIHCSNSGPFSLNDSSQPWTHLDRKSQPSMLVEAYGHVHLLLVLFSSSVLLYITLPAQDYVENLTEMSTSICARMEKGMEKKPLRLFFSLLLISAAHARSLLESKRLLFFFFFKSFSPLSQTL